MVLLISAVVGTLVTVAWLRFPTVVPLAVEIAVTLLAGVAALVCTPLVVLRLFRRLAARGGVKLSFDSPLGLPARRVLVSFALAAAVLNVSLAYFCGPRKCAELFLVANVLFPFVWILARRDLRARLQRRKERPGA